MSGRRKRQRLSEDGSAAVTTYSGGDMLVGIHSASETPGRETNASARRSLFVRSLPATATSEALTELFSDNYPLKHATVVLDPVTKQSKGYGFVTFTDGDDAQRAKDEFNGYNFQGRKLKVEIAEPRRRELHTSNKTTGKSKSLPLPEIIAAKKAREEKLAESRKPPKLIIRNLPWSIKEPEELATLFRRFGKIKHCVLPKKREDQQAGFGFVVIRGRKNAEKALTEVNGLNIDGRTLAVDWAVDKEAWEGQKQAEEDIVEERSGKEAQEDDDSGIDIGEDEGGALLKAEDDVAEDDVANFMKNNFDNLESEDEENRDEEVEDTDEDGVEADLEGGSDGWVDEDGSMDGNEREVEKSKAPRITDNSSTLFVRNLPFTILDTELKEQFMRFGPVRYARVVMDRITNRPKGTGFVCFFNVEDADKCLKGAPRYQPTGANAIKKGKTSGSFGKQSILEDETVDITGVYTMEGRLLHISHAVEKEQAVKLAEEGTAFRDGRDKDKRRLYLLKEGTVASGTPLYSMLSPSEIKMREDSAKQRKKLIQNNPSLHLSLTRLSIRNIPRSITSRDLKALAREAVVGFAKDAKNKTRAPLSKEEESRGGDSMREAEKQRKAKGKGIVKQSKIVFEGREGAKVSEESGAGRSRGYGFIEYSSHRWALMGLRWLNGRAMESGSGKKQRLIVEFAIENAQVVSRRREKEEKARVRSKEVLEARERGEVPEKQKKVLKRDTIMARTRKGMKPGRKGKPKTGSEKISADTDKGNIKPGLKRKRDNEDTPARKSAKPNAQPPSALPAAGDDAKLARRQQIISKKRAMRRARKKGGQS